LHKHARYQVTRTVWRGKIHCVGCKNSVICHRVSQLSLLITSARISGYVKTRVLNGYWNGYLGTRTPIPFQYPS